VDDSVVTGAQTGPGGERGAARHYKRDFWSKENLKFTEPHFRMEKAARIINRIADGKDSDLLDVGCGPAALAGLLQENIHYHGIDIAIHDQAPYLRETDFLEAPIGFEDRQFSIVLAQGVFEYLGASQLQKFAEIRDILMADGKFIVTYWNFSHLNKHIYERFSNIQPLNEFRQSLACYFNIDRSFPASHNWHHHAPGRKLMKAAQRHINMNIPLVSRAFAVEYFFICSPRPANGTGIPA
jgi:SAM-dependent methyltransferase